MVIKVKSKRRHFHTAYHKHGRIGSFCKLQIWSVKKGLNFILTRGRLIVPKKLHQYLQMEQNRHPLLSTLQARRECFFFDPNVDKQNAGIELIK